MSRIRNGKTEDGKVKWTYFRKRKHKRSLIRQIMYVASMIGIVSASERRIELKRKNGILITKRIEYAKKN